jgi:arylsulfatase A-like enzyme
MNSTGTRKLSWRCLLSQGPATDRVTDAPPPPGSGPFALIATGAWFGLVAGLIEVATVLLWLQIDGSSILGSLQMNRHFLWMIPLSHLVIFSVLAIPTAILAPFRPQSARFLSIFLPCWLGWFSLLSIAQGLHVGARAALGIGLAYQLTPRIISRAAGFAKVVRISLPILLGVVGLLGLGSFDRLVLKERRTLATLPAAAPGAPNVLLIVLDTVRADRLSLYGYGRGTTSNLDRLAARGVVFSEARSPAPWTLPSHATLFTARWPHELGLEDGRTLDSTWPTLAEHLANRGYATSGFVGNTYFCNSWYGLARGFLHYEDYYEENLLVSPEEALRCTALGRWLIRMVGTSYLARPEAVHYPKDAARVRRDFLRWVDDHPDRPFFSFLNFIDAHDPYQTPPGFDHHFGLKPETVDDFNLIRSWNSRDKTTLTPRELTLINDAYDDCLAYVDQQVGGILDDLERRGRLDETVVIITSDHGEQFGDRKLFGHGNSLYRPELHVPLIIAAPGRIPAGRVVSQPVTLRDIPATVVDQLREDTALSPFPGRSLARFWETDSSELLDDEPFLSEIDATRKIAKTPIWPPSRRGPMASLVAEGHVYIRDALGAEELFDIAQDPEERHDLIGNEASRGVLERCRIAFDQLVPAGRGRP